MLLLLRTLLHRTFVTLTFLIQILLIRTLAITNVSESQLFETQDSFESGGGHKEKEKKVSAQAKEKSGRKCVRACERVRKGG